MMNGDGLLACPYNIRAKTPTTSSQRRDSLPINPELQAGARFTNVLILLSQSSTNHFLIKKHTKEKTEIVELGESQS